MSPLFDYRCPACGATTENLEPFDSPRPECQCKAEMERMPNVRTSWKFGEGK